MLLFDVAQPEDECVVVAEYVSLPNALIHQLDAQTFGENKVVLVGDVTVKYGDVGCGGVETSGLQAFHETYDEIFRTVPVAHEHDLILGEEEVFDRVEDLLTTLSDEVGDRLFLVVVFGVFF